jgi:hypothetical protein
MDWTELIKNISIIIASWTAVYGTDQWRRECRGKRQAELAEEVLSLFYEAQDAVRHIRNPFGFGGEGASRKAGENETPEEKDAFDKAFVIFERFKTKKKKQRGKTKRKNKETNKEGQRLFSGLASAFLEATPPVVTRVTLRSP